MDWKGKFLSYIVIEAGDRKSGRGSKSEGGIEEVCVCVGGDRRSGVEGGIEEVGWGYRRSGVGGGVSKKWGGVQIIKNLLL